MHKEEAKKAIIYHLLWERIPLSQNKLAELTGFHLPTVTALIAELVEEGLALQTGYGESTGGRKPLLFKINPQSKLVIGVNVEGNSVTSVLLDLEGKVKEKHFISTNEQKRFFQTKEELLKSISHSLKKIIGKTNRKSIKGIGIGISGLVDRERGISIEFPRLENWNNVALGEMLNKEFSFPVFLNNGVNTATLAEKWWGKGRNSDNFLYLYLGLGIGMGVVINGQMYRGATGNLGELGHITVKEDGPICYCGNYGCLETFASEEALVNQAVNALEGARHSSILDLCQGEVKKITPHIIFEAAEKGDKLAHNIVEHTGECLGVAIASLVNLLNPGLIILGGTFAEAGDLILEPIKRTLKRRALARLGENLQLTFSELGAEGGAIGAGTLVLEEILKRR